MARMTPAEYEALWNPISSTPPQNPPLRYTYLCGNATLWGMSATRVHNGSTVGGVPIPAMGAAWGIVLEHPKRGGAPGELDHLYITFGTPPLGWTANNVVTFQGNRVDARDPITCPGCSFTGSLQGSTVTVTA